MPMTSWQHLAVSMADVEQATCIPSIRNALMQVQLASYYSAGNLALSTILQPVAVLHEKCTNYCDAVDFM